MRPHAPALDYEEGKMKRISMACSLCTLALLGGSAWAAPRHSRTKPRAKPAAARPAPATEVTIYEASGTDIRGFGVATKWTLRPNGTVVREGNLAGMNMGDPGQPFREHGTFEPSDFNPLVAFLESSGLLSLKRPKPAEMEGTTSISIVRGSKRRAVVIPDSAPSSAAWAAMKLVRGITQDVDWKNDAGFSVNTGVQVQFLVPDDALHADFHGDFPRFSVRNAAGKQAAEALVQDESGGIRQPLPPGTYTIVPATPAYAKPNAQGLIWRPSQEKFEIVPGSFTHITIALQKAPAAP